MMGRVCKRMKNEGEIVPHGTGGVATAFSQLEGEILGRHRAELESLGSLRRALGLDPIWKGAALGSMTTVGEPVEADLNAKPAKRAKVAARQRNGSVQALAREVVAGWPATKEWRARELAAELRARGVEAGNLEKVLSVFVIGEHNTGRLVRRKEGGAVWYRRPSGGVVKAIGTERTEAPEPKTPVSAKWAMREQIAAEIAAKKAPAE